MRDRFATKHSNTGRHFSMIGGLKDVERCLLERSIYIIRGCIISYAFGLNAWQRLPNNTKVFNTDASTAVYIRSL